MHLIQHLIAFHWCIVAHRRASLAQYFSCKGEEDILANRKRRLRLEALPGSAIDDVLRVYPECPGADVFVDTPGHIHGAVATTAQGNG